MLRGHLLRLITERDCSREAELLFLSFLVLSVGCGLAALYGAAPPDPAVHWPGHKWIHFMKRFHVIMSIGCFLIEMCATFFSLFALHRVLAGGFDTRAQSTAALLMRELEFEYVAVCSYAFAGAWLLMGPVAIRCFCMVQQGLRSDSLAAAVCCLIVGTFLLVLSFFNAHLVAFPYDSYDSLVHRFIQLSLTRLSHGGRPAVVTALAWALQGVSVLLAALSLVETFPFIYYRELDRGTVLAHAAADAAADGPPAPERAVDEAADEDGVSDTISDAPAVPHARRELPLRSTPAAVAAGRAGAAADVPAARGAPRASAPAQAALWGFGASAPSYGSPAHPSPPPPPPNELRRERDRMPSQDSLEEIGNAAAAAAASDGHNGGSGHVRFGTDDGTPLLVERRAGPRALASPLSVPLGGGGGAGELGPAAALASSHPWSIALAHCEPRALQQSLAQPSAGGGAGSLGHGLVAPAAGGAAGARGVRAGRSGFSKVSSIASSMVSLDSTAVD